MTHAEKSKADQLRAEVQKEINANKISIDKSCFVKTQEEKDELYKLKTAWKVNTANGYNYTTIKITG